VFTKKGKVIPMEQSAVMENDLVNFPLETSEEVDPVDEIRLRTWARVNYLPVQKRNHNWHPVVHDEMNRKDRELSC